MMDEEKKKKTNGALAVRILSNVSQFPGPQTCAEKEKDQSSSASAPFPQILRLIRFVKHKLR